MGQPDPSKVHGAAHTPSRRGQAMASKGSHPFLKKGRVGPCWGFASNSTVSRSLATTRQHVHDDECIHLANHRVPNHTFQTH